MINSILGKLHAAENMDVRDMRLQFRQENFTSLWAIGSSSSEPRMNERLQKFASSPAPARPEAELEEPDWERSGRGNHVDHADQGLLAAEFRPHILAKDAWLAGRGGMEVRFIG